MRWLDFGARNRLSDKGCHPFYEFPYDTAKICSFSLFAKPVRTNIRKVYQNGYSIFTKLEQAVDDRLDDGFHLVVSVRTRMEIVIQTIVRM